MLQLKVIHQPPGNYYKIHLKEGYWGAHVWHVPQKLLTRKTLINLLDLGTIWKAWQQFREEIKGKIIFFHIDNVTALSHVMKEGATHCKKMNDLVRKTWLRCHKDGVMVCPECFYGVANLRIDALSRGMEAQDCSLGTPPITGCSGWKLQKYTCLQLNTIKKSLKIVLFKTQLKSPSFNIFSS